MKKNNAVLKSSDLQDKVICPICNKEFKLKEKYIIAGGYACKWKCFLKEVKRQEAERKTEEKGKNNRQNKR